jgi:hypothetical protein
LMFLYEHDIIYSIDDNFNNEVNNETIQRNS